MACAAVEAYPELPREVSVLAYLASHLRACECAPEGRGGLEQSSLCACALCVYVLGMHARARARATRARVQIHDAPYASARLVDHRADRVFSRLARMCALAHARARSTSDLTAVGWKRGRSISVRARIMCTHARMHACKMSLGRSLHVSIRVLSCVHTHVHTHVHAHVRAHVHRQVFTCAHAHVCTHVCTHICTHVCTHVCMHVHTQVQR